MSGLDYVAEWVHEPSTDAIERVCRRYLGIRNDSICNVMFYGDKRYIKEYLVLTNDWCPSMIMRIYQPVCPRYRTRGEVVTIEWVAENTSIPVPKVIAYDNSNDNEIGFEWILMEQVNGISAEVMWEYLTEEQKVMLARQIAEFQEQLVGDLAGRPHFRGIGTLQPRVSGGAGGPLPQRLTGAYFYAGDRINYNEVDRGPFRSSHDWLLSFLGIVMQDWKNLIAKTEDVGKIQEAMYALSVAGRLYALVPMVFPPIQAPPERTALTHYDLSLSNILLDHECRISAVLG
jgi:hypothetical protein